MGQGTAEVESLASYILRSAYEHGVSVGMFLQLVHELSIGSRKVSAVKIRGNIGIARLARSNSMTWALRDQLAKLTGQDISCEPLRFLDSKVYCISTEIDGLRWCPECLAEMEHIGVPLYFKQLWHMRTVVSCPIHRVRLAGQCELCNSNQCSLKAIHPVGFCVDCGAPLSKRKRMLLPKDISPSWECPSHDVLDVFEKASKPGPIENGWFVGKNFSFPSPLTTRNGRLDYFLNDDVMALIQQCGLNWRGGFRLISLRRLAHLLNLSLYEMLMFDGDVRKLPLTTVEAAELPDHLKIRKKTTRNHKQVYQNVVDYLDTQEIPPSLKQVARFAGVSIGYLEYRFPCLVRRIVESHKAYCDQKSLVNRYQAQAAALRFFIDDRYADYNHSRKEAYRVLKDETGLPKWVLKNAIQTAYGVLQAGA